jgi:flagellar protein FliS
MERALMTTKYAEYQSMNNEQAVQNASPHQLIQILFDKCETNLNLAVADFKKDQTHDCFSRLLNTVNIYEYLRMCLKKDEVTNELSQQLEVVYSYSINQLLNMCQENNIDNIDSVRNMLGTIKSAWHTIGASL